MLRRALAHSETVCPRRRSESPLQVVDEKSFDIAPSNSVKPGYGGIHHTMSKLKVTFISLMLPLVLLFGSPHADSPNPGTKNNS